MFSDWFLELVGNQHVRLAKNGFTSGRRMSGGLLFCLIAYFSQPIQILVRLTANDGELTVGHKLFGGVFSYLLAISVSFSPTTICVFPILKSCFIITTAVIIDFANAISHAPLNSKSGGGVKRRVHKQASITTNVTVCCSLSIFYRSTKRYVEPPIGGGHLVHHCLCRYSSFCRSEAIFSVSVSRRD